MPKDVQLARLRERVTNSIDHLNLIPITHSAFMGFVLIRQVHKPIKAAFKEWGT